MWCHQDYPKGRDMGTPWCVWSLWDLQKLGNGFCRPCMDISSTCILTCWILLWLLACYSLTSRWKWTQLPFVFQIAAQELSDNRVITLSMAGRKLDKKVSGDVSEDANVKLLSFIGWGIWGDLSLWVWGCQKVVPQQKAGGWEWRSGVRSWLCHLLQSKPVPQFLCCHHFTFFVMHS